MLARWKSIPRNHSRKRLKNFHFPGDIESSSPHLSNETGCFKAMGMNLFVQFLIISTSCYENFNGQKPSHVSWTYKNNGRKIVKQYVKYWSSAILASKKGLMILIVLEGFFFFIFWKKNLRTSLELHSKKMQIKNLSSFSWSHLN